jgi:uncharacterized LabA/DUF88 family protein
MHFYPDERVGLFIDGPNIYASTQALGFTIDYKRLLSEFGRRGRLVRALFYLSLAENEGYSTGRPFADWLDYNGFSVMAKPAAAYVDPFGERRVKGGVELELAVDAMRLAGSLDHIVLFSGDGDYHSLTVALQNRGRRVSVVSTINAFSATASDRLRRQADQFIDLADLKPRIQREPRPKLNGRALLESASHAL